MDGHQFNTLVAFTIGFVGVVSWAYILVVDPQSHPVSAPVMFLIALGLLTVSGLSLAQESWWVGVVAAINRTVVAGSGLRAVYRYHHPRTGAGAARREP